MHQRNNNTNNDMTIPVLYAYYTTQYDHKSTVCIHTIYKQYNNINYIVLLLVMVMMTKCI